MIEITKKEGCAGCTSCAQACPKHCIFLIQDQEGFLYPRVEMEGCINCNLCLKVCPSLNYTDYHPIIASYGGFTKDAELRKSSSSGGIFGTIAENVILENGIVFAVAMDDSCSKAEFYKVQTKEGLSSLRGAKYVQAYPLNVFVEIKEILGEGKKVLFAGTPCQVNGLMLFLHNKKYANLLTIDFICHGCPSPKLWKKYIDYLKKNNNSKISYFNFRAKEYGWRDYGLYYGDSKGDMYFSKKSEDPYMQLFLQNISLRPSCYKCAAKTFRLSDLTIGDFWGVENIAPEYDDDKGISAIIIRSDKGQKAFEAVSNNIISFKCKYDDIAKYNYPEYKSVPLSKYRQKFFKDFDEMSIEELKKKYLATSLKHKIKIAVEHVIKAMIFRLSKNMDD